MDQPLISVIVPTYNRLLFLAELIESLSRQTLQDFEVIIINDNGEKVDIIKKMYPELKIKLIEMDRNGKHVLARNQGVMSAGGEFIMLIDDDDLLVPTHIESMLKEISSVDLVYSDVEIVKYQQKEKIRIPVDRFLFAYDLDLEAMRRFSTFVPSGSLYRRSIHKTIGLFDPEVNNYWDWDFFLRVSEKYHIARLPSAGVLYDFSDSNNNNSKNLSSMRLYLDRLSKKHNLGYLPTKNFYLLLNEPEVKQREVESKIVWDGKPMVSRMALLRQEEA